MTKQKVIEFLERQGARCRYSGKEKTLYIQRPSSWTSNSEIVIGQKYGILPDFQLKEVENE